MRASPTEQLLERYEDAYRELALDDEAGRVALMNAALGCGFLFGAGFPGAAATLARLFRKAHPGVAFPWFFEGEEAL